MDGASGRGGGTGRMDGTGRREASNEDKGQVTWSIHGHCHSFNSLVVISYMY